MHLTVLTAVFVWNRVLQLCAWEANLFGFWLMIFRTVISEERKMEKIYWWPCPEILKSQNKLGWDFTLQWLDMRGMKTAYTQIPFLMAHDSLLTSSVYVPKLQRKKTIGVMLIEHFMEPICIDKKAHLSHFEKTHFWKWQFILWIWYGVRRRFINPHQGNKILVIWYRISYQYYIWILRR